MVMYNYYIESVKQRECCTIKKRKANEYINILKNKRKVHNTGQNLCPVTPKWL